jgi:hypothetical protein
MIPEIKKILYATDLSKNSVYAFRYALKVAEKVNSQIVISGERGPLGIGSSPKTSSYRSSSLRGNRSNYWRNIMLFKSEKGGGRVQEKA